MGKFLAILLALICATAVYAFDRLPAVDIKTPIPFVHLRYDSLQAKLLKAQAAPSRDRDRWRATAGRYLASATAWKAHWAAEHANRTREAAQAKTDAATLTRSCTARIAAARRSSDLIGKLLETPANETAPNGCPVERLLDPIGLRDAIGAGGAVPSR